MNIQQIVSRFSGTNGMTEAKKYLEAKDVLHLILQKSQQIKERISPDFRDLARLYAVVRARKVFTILEFGIGYSTIVMAKALERNRDDWNAFKDKPLIRKSNPFQIHSIDASKKWIDITLNGIRKECKNIVHAHNTKVTPGLFNGRSCHFYDQIPNVVPDFIYLDGPHPKQVNKKDGAGSDWANNPDRVVMSGDLLRIEPILLPGTCILIDGRTANARFLNYFFYRSWASARDANGDVTAMELQEPSLGEINQSTLNYTLGDGTDKWILN